MWQVTLIPTEKSAMPFTPRFPSRWNYRAQIALVVSFVEILMCVSALRQVARANDAALLARMHEEAPKAWAELVKLADHLDMEAHVTWSQRHRKVETLNRVKISGDNKLTSVTTTKVPDGDNLERAGEARVTAENSKYGFHIEKREEGKPWMVDFVGQPANVSEKIENGGVRSAIQFTTKVGDLYLPDVLAKPTFKINSIEKRTGAAGELVAVTFENREPASQRSPEGRTIKDGSFVLNPQRHWAVEEYQVRVEMRDGRIEYWTKKTVFRDEPSGSADPLTSRTTYGPDPMSVNYYDDWNFDKFNHNHVPESEFTLSAFGLPEVGAPSLFAQGRLWMVLVASGVVCIVIAIVVRRRVGAT
jgi:hypothetical protein